MVGTSYMYCTVVGPRSGSIPLFVSTTIIGDIRRAVISLLHFVCMYQDPGDDGVAGASIVPYPIPQNNEA